MSVLEASGLEPDSVPLNCSLTEREREREREREEEREKLFDFDMAMHCFSWGPYIREEGESSFLGVE